MGAVQSQAGLTTAVATIAATRTFFAALAAGLDGDVGQVELALAVLAGLELDEQTLDNFQTVQQDAQRAAGRCRATIAVLDARHRQMEEAVNATPDAARTAFYRDGTGGNAVRAASPVPAEASRAASLAAAAAAVTGDAGRTPLAGGLAADTYRVTLPDGRRVVHKRGRGDDVDWLRRQADAEILVAAVAEVVGARVAAVLRDPQDPAAVFVEYIDGPPPARQAGVGTSPELNAHPAAVRLGLLDALIGSADRQAIMAQEGPVGIDHEQAWSPGATGPWDLPSPAGQPVEAFADQQGFKPGPLPREELEALQAPLQALRPLFEDLGRGDWHDYVMAAHGRLCDRAVPAARAPLPEPPLRGAAVLDVPALDLAAMTAAGDPRAEALWWRTGDNSTTSGYGMPGFVVLHEHLRSPYHEPGIRPDLDRITADIDAVMADSVLTRPIEVYRGLSLYGLIDAEPGQWQGRAFHDPAPATVTADPAEAARHGTVMTVTVPPGVGAVRLADRPGDDPGQGLLLQRGLTYLVVDEQVTYDDRGGVAGHHLRVEVVPPRGGRPAAHAAEATAPGEGQTGT